MSHEKTRAKGSAFLGMIESVKKTKGTDTVEKIFMALTNDLQDKFKYKGIVQSGWYPIEWFLQLLAAVKKTEGGRREVLRELGKSMLKDALLGGVYKYARLILTRKSILKKAPFFFDSYIDGATMKILEVTNTGGHIQCTNCKGFNADIWEVVIGGVLGVVEVNKGTIKSVTIHSGGGDGDDMMDLELGFNWDIEID
jgi:hypothetical protein